MENGKDDIETQLEQMGEGQEDAEAKKDEALNDESAPPEASKEELTEEAKVDEATEIQQAEIITSATLVEDGTTTYVQYAIDPKTNSHIQVRSVCGLSVPEDCPIPVCGVKL